MTQYLSISKMKNLGFCNYWFASRFLYVVHFMYVFNCALFLFGVGFLFCLIWGVMASKLQQLQSKACQATQFIAKHGTSYHKQLLEQNRHYIQEPPTIEKCNLLAKQLFYTRLARLHFIQPCFRFWLPGWIQCIIFSNCKCLLATIMFGCTFGIHVRPQKSR